MEIIKLLAPPSENEIESTWTHVEHVYVSIVCITFNQENYIRDAIDSFLAQETEYRFEIIIHDDLSTDSTRSILREYKNKYPNIVKLVLQDTNQYSLGKRISPLAVAHASGEYVALCEGDDFWIDKNKIDKQIKLFFENEKISLVHTGTLDLVEQTNESIVSDVPSHDNTTLALFKRNRIRTLTTMFKMVDYIGFYSDHGDEANKWLLGDWPLWIYLSMRGQIVLLPSITSVYRILVESASHSTDYRKLNVFRLSTYDMRLYMAYKSMSPNETLAALANSSLVDHMLHNTPLIERAYELSSNRYKFLFILNSIVPVKKIVSLRNRCRSLF